MPAYHGAEIFLFHVVEDVSGQVFGGGGGDEEVRDDQRRLDRIAAQLKESGINATPLPGFGPLPGQINQ